MEQVLEQIAAVKPVKVPMAQYVAGMNISPDEKSALIDYLSRTREASPFTQFAYSSQKRPASTTPKKASRASLGLGLESAEDKKNRYKAMGDATRARIAKAKEDNRFYHTVLDSFGGEKRKKIARYSGRDEKTGIPIRNANYNLTQDYGPGITKHRAMYTLRKKSLSPSAMKAIRFLGPQAVFDLGGFHDTFYPLRKTVTQKEVMDFMNMELAPFREDSGNSVDGIGGAIKEHWTKNQLNTIRGKEDWRQRKVRWDS